jgi:predicted ATPase
VQLFVDRAQAARPSFQVTSRNAADVAALCAHLEGLPLAIELAAARSQVMTPRQMLSQVSHRFDFLVSRHRDTEARHTTLRAVVDWSYRLLSEELQRFFTQLSVFRGGWTLEAASAISGEALTLDWLSELSDSSLLVTEESVSEEMRFRMLETMREYAQEQMTAEEANALARHHAEYYTALAEEGDSQLKGAEQKQWMERLEADHDNLRAAFDWSLNEKDEGGRRKGKHRLPPSPCGWQARWRVSGSTGIWSRVRSVCHRRWHARTPQSGQPSGRRRCWGRGCWTTIWATMLRPVRAARRAWR